MAIIIITSTINSIIWQKHYTANCYYYELSDGTTIHLPDCHITAIPLNQNTASWLNPKSKPQYSHLSILTEHNTAIIPNQHTAARLNHNTAIPLNQSTASWLNPKSKPQYSHLSILTEHNMAIVPNHYAAVWLSHWTAIWQNQIHNVIFLSCRNCLDTRWQSSTSQSQECGQKTVAHGSP